MPRIDLYYCSECKQRHMYKSKIGRRHIEYETVTPEPQPKGETSGGQGSDLTEAIAPQHSPGTEVPETVSIEDYLMSLTDALRVHETDIGELKKEVDQLRQAFAPIDEALQEAKARPAAQQEGMSIPISGDMGGRVMSFLETAISKWGGGGGGGEDLGASKEAVDAIAYEIARKAKIQNDTMEAWGKKLRAAKSVDFEEAP